MEIGRPENRETSMQPVQLICASIRVISPSIHFKSNETRFLAKIGEQLPAAVPSGDGRLMSREEEGRRPHYSQIYY
jgi:hypothetical protein